MPHTVDAEDGDRLPGRHLGRVHRGNPKRPRVPATAPRSKSGWLAFAPAPACPPTPGDSISLRQLHVAVAAQHLTPRRAVRAGAAERRKACHDAAAGDNKSRRARRLSAHSLSHSCEAVRPNGRFRAATILYFLTSLHRRHFRDLSHSQVARQLCMN